jgi:hypothetical protein
MFKERLGLKEPQRMSELLTRVQPYINYEEKLLADKVEKGKGSDKKDVKGRDERTKKSARGNYTTF